MCVYVFKDGLANTVCLERWEGWRKKRDGEGEKGCLLYQNGSCIRLSYLHDTCDFSGHLLIVSVQMGERLLGRGLYVF